MADGVRAVLGDGSALGIRLRYVEEPRPLGTGGALKFAEELLDERFFMLNGDVLTDIDLTAQLAQHERTGRARHARADRRSTTPRRTGSCGCDADGSVTRVRREAGPGADRHEPDQRRRLHPRARRARRRWPPAGHEHLDRARRVPDARRPTACSATRRAATGSTSARPTRYLQATFDILEGNVETEIGRRLRGSRAGARRRRDRSTAGWSRPALVGVRLLDRRAGAIVGGRTRARRRT